MRRKKVEAVFVFDGNKKHFLVQFKAKDIEAALETIKKGLKKR